MGFFSSRAVQSRTASDQIADVLFFVRQEMRFLDEYRAAGREASDALMRLDFSKDVLLLLLSTALVQGAVRDHERNMQINDQVRTRYLKSIPVHATSLICDCLACEDELEAIGSFVSPGASLPEIRTTVVSRIGLISLVTDFRAPEFRADFSAGVAQQQFGWDLTIPVCRRFLSRIRGVSTEAIDSDDICELAIALILPFEKLMTIEGFLR